MPRNYRLKENKSGELTRGQLMMQEAAKNKKIAAALATYAISLIAVEIYKSLGGDLEGAFNKAFILMTETDLKLRQWQKENGDI
jgi:hypothetical protein